VPDRRARRRTRACRRRQPKHALIFEHQLTQFVSASRRSPTPRRARRTRVAIRGSDAYQIALLIWRRRHGWSQLRRRSEHPKAEWHAVLLLTRSCLRRSARASRCQHRPDQAISPERLIVELDRLLRGYCDSTRGCEQSPVVLRSPQGTPCAPRRGRRDQPAVHEPHARTGRVAGRDHDNGRTAVTLAESASTTRS